MQENKDARNQEHWMRFLLQEQETPSNLFENTFKAAIDITGLPVAEAIRLRHETHLRVDALVDQIGVPYQAGDEFALNELLAGQIISKRDGLVIPDISNTPLARHPAALQFGIRCFIGTPLILSNKQIYGALALYDRNPHPLGKDELIRLSLVGQALSQQIELRQANRELFAKTERLASVTQELQRLQNQLEQGSIRDPITELLNSRHFNKVLQNESSRARRHKDPLSLLLLYPDGFPSLKRQWGVEVSNTVLSSISVLLRRHLRAIDNAARYTEEIFAILLPQTNLAGARIVADRIHNTISTHPFQATHSQMLPMTVSIGITDLNPSESEMAIGLLTRARQCLEQARNAGGNRVMIKSAH